MKIGIDARHEIFIKVIEGDKSKRHMIANVNIIIARKLFHKIFIYHRKENFMFMVKVQASRSILPKTD